MTNRSLRSLITGALLAASLAAVASAQSRVSWDVQHRHGPYPFVHTEDLAPTPDGGAVAFGIAYATESAALDRDGNAQVLAIGLDADGEVRWTWTAPCSADPWEPWVGRGQYVSGDVDGAGNAYVVFSQPARSTIACIDSSGVELWRSPIEGLPGVGLAYHAMFTAVAPSGLVHVAGARYDGGVVPYMDVHAFDAQGGLAWQWSAVAGANSWGIPHGMVVTPSGETHVYGQSDLFGAGYPFTSRRTVLDPTGHVIATTGGPSSSEVVTLSGGIGPQGDLAFVSVGWVSNFPNSDPYHRLDVVRAGGGGQTIDLIPLALNRGHQCVTVDAQGNALLYGAVGQIDRVSPAGVLLAPWGMPGLHRVQDVVPTLDGGVLLTGHGVIGGVGGAIDARLDAQGQVVWSSLRRGTLLPGGSYAGPATIAATRPRLALDPRGNVLGTSRTVDLAGGDDWRMGVAKVLEGGPVGAGYCPAAPNSTGAPAVMVAFGSAERAVDNVTLMVSGLPVNTFVLLIAGRARAALPAPGGTSGTLCVGGGIGRFVQPGQVRRSRESGVATLQLDLGSLPRPGGLVAATAGQTWTFQSWYRDVVGGAPTANFSGAVELVLQ